MKLRTHDWKPDTPDFVTHDVLATYIQDTAAANDILSNISFRTRVNKIEKKEAKWEVSTSKLVEEAGEKEIRNTVHVRAFAHADREETLITRTGVRCSHRGKWTLSCSKHT